METPFIGPFLQFLERTGEVIAVLLFGAMIYFVFAA